VVICLERGADLHMAQLMPLPLTVSCSSKIQIGFTFLVPAHPGRPGQRAVKRVCVDNTNWTEHSRTGQEDQARSPNNRCNRSHVLHTCKQNTGGSVAEWLACWTQAQKGLGSNRSRDAVG